MLAVGAVEETGFRYAVIGIIMALAVPAAGFLPAAVVAVAASSAVFAIMHLQYQGFTVGLVGTLGVLLGVTYVATGSLAAVIIAHWLYDTAVVFNEARKMTADPHYFAGEPPMHAIEEELGRISGD